MYEISRYVGANDFGTAVLLERLIASKTRRIVVASSMSVYGEGLYETKDGKRHLDVRRILADIPSGWDPTTRDGGTLHPIPTDETKATDLSSVYAVTKYVQERNCLIVGRAYGIEAVALRLFNVFGPGQALSNPYTGVLANFGARLLNGERPLVFEDGQQKRDFVHVRDVAIAFRLAMEHAGAAGHVINIGSGRAYTVSEVAEMLADAMQVSLGPLLLGKARKGDIRHCFADISKARQLLGFAPAKPSRGHGRRTRRLDQVASRARQGRGRQTPTRGTRAGGMNEVLAAPHVGRPSGHVVIFGGCGFIGCNLADELLAEGRDVVVFDNLSRPGVGRNLEWLSSRHPRKLHPAIADIRDRDAVREHVSGAAAAFHFAAQVAVTSSLADPTHDFAVNAAGTVTILEALRQHAPATPLVFASTNKVYGTLADLAFEVVGGAYTPNDPSIRDCGIGESRPLAFCTPYGCSKGVADQYVLDYARSFGMRTASLRMSCIYGPRQFGTEDQGWVAHFLLTALRGQPITLFGNGNQVRDILHVADAVAAYRAVLARIDSVSGTAFNLGGGPENAVSLRDVVAEIASLTGVETLVSQQDWRTGDQLYFVADTRRLETATGWRRQVGWREGVRDLAGWLMADIDAREQSRARPLPVLA